MIDDALRDHLQGGVSIIVGTVSPTGEPHAAKGYGVVPIDDEHVDVLLDASETELIEFVGSCDRLAVTSGNVFSFQSVQLKGSVVAVGPATTEQHDTATELMKRFNARIAQLQNLPQGYFDRRIPSEFVACRLRVDDIFDQSPGPMAGARLPRGAR